MSSKAHSIKLSIVIPYYNRINLLKWTLQSIYENKNNNFEVIIVDDASDDNEELYILSTQYQNLNIVSINKKEKGNRTNPSVPFNRGISLAKGEIIILQNPESYHVGNIIDYVDNNLKIDDYFIFSAYNLHNEKNNIDFINLQKKTLKSIELLPRLKSHLVWYQHPVHRNLKYHFCSAIYKKNIDIIGGFDEVYGEGVCFDDEDLFFKIEQIGKFNIVCLDPIKSPFVVNMYHPPSSSNAILDEKNNNPIKIRWLKNSNYFNTKVNSINPEFLYPRIAHFFWNGPLSFLNYLSILSFHKYHPAWIINVFQSHTGNRNNIWKTGEQKQFEKYNEDYFECLKKLKYVNVICIDNILKELGIDKIYMVHQSDIIRMYILNVYGGIYSDFDIIYIDNIEKYFLNKTKTLVFDRKIFDNNGNKIVHYCPNAFFVANKNCDFLKYVINKQLDYVKNKVVKGYNNVGPEIIKEIVLGKQHSAIKKNIEILNSTCYLPLEWNELNKLYIDTDFVCEDKYFSIHWFNGAKESKQYIDNFSEKEFAIKCKMDKLVSIYIDSLFVQINKKDEMLTIFTNIYNNNIWNIDQKETRSGNGSTITQTITIRTQLPKLFNIFNIKSILDAGCGDFNWMKMIHIDGINYIGVDVVEEIINENNNLYQKNNIVFEQKEIMSDMLPKSDLILCRDCLVLFSNDDIKQTLINFKKSGSRYLLITNFNKKRQFNDIKTGMWRPLNLQCTPFNLPPPILSINENCTEANMLYKDKCLDLWDLNNISI